MKSRSIFIIALALFLPLCAGCDNDNNSRAQDMDGMEPPGAEAPMSMTMATGTVDASGEGCTGIDGLATGDEVEIVIVVTGTSAGDTTVTNMSTGDTASCDMGFIQREKNKLPANILCKPIKTSNISGLPTGDVLEIAIDFQTDTNQLTVINAETSDCVNITMTSLDAG
jgi:hypothetical protein